MGPKRSALTIFTKTTEFEMVKCWKYRKAEVFENNLDGTIELAMEFQGSTIEFEFVVCWLSLSVFCKEKTKKRLRKRRPHVRWAATTCYDYQPGKLWTHVRSREHV